MGGYERAGKPKGFSLREQLNRAGFTDLEPGAVVRVADSKLSFPHNLFRKVHASRMGLVLSNHRLCASRNDVLIVIAPMTHRLDIRLETDVFVERTAENGLESDSLVQMHLIQPVLKSEVQRRVGILGAKEWDDVIQRLFWMTNRE